MSNYHVKNISDDGRKANVVFHIPILAENNGVGVALRTALSQSINSSNFVSQVPWIQGAELIQIQNGELYEHVEAVTFLAADTNTEKQTRINARYTVLTTFIVSKVQATLVFWGLDKDVT